MKCQVRWIDSKGQPTPDDNDAVMLAHFHKPIWGTPGPDNRILGYHPTDIEQTLFICAEHYAMVNDSFRPPRGGWTFEPLPSQIARVVDPYIFMD